MLQTKPEFRRRKNKPQDTGTVWVATLLTTVLSDSCPGWNTILRICKGGGKPTCLINTCWLIDYQVLGTSVRRDNMGVFKGDIFICISAD